MYCFLATMSSSSNDRWIRAAMPLEEWFEMGHKHGTFLACYVLTLGSPQPLDHNHVKQALLHLYRKVPSLRLSMDTRDGVLWFKECTRETIDFEVVTDCDLDNVVSHLRTYRYNCKLGPMWCARFLPAASATVAGESEAAVATLILSLAFPLMDPLPILILYLILANARTRCWIQLLKQKPVLLNGRPLVLFPVRLLAVAFIPALHGFAFLCSQ
nr:uncharacterized protein LOC128695274 [Cherax quadricarinatus]